MLPHIEAKITLFKSDGQGNGRLTSACSGYRPAHLIKDDYLTTGIHQYYGDVFAQPGETVMGTITFITPEYYPRTLWIGKCIRIQEGARIVGQAEVTQIFNELLIKAEGFEADDSFIDYYQPGNLLSRLKGALLQKKAKLP
ncbi:hypothetical protein [Paenibacillus sp. MMS20-IR301]|uniref:hypothetical protein n=1 Tax=Paenibacillus sp. MMS20-IR301 TaxID=2895946 RepID=UPI0028E37458|nr:hypothetical protein [Paenibacillus sp. MMS20-IR301]WNS45335.1 hypothetical protein LOS79_08705 [Paenibacillus sp. MMS20-IR301]